MAFLVMTLCVTPAFAQSPFPAPSVSPAVPLTAPAQPDGKSTRVEFFDGPWDWSEPTQKEGRKDYFLASEKVGESSNSFLRADYIPSTKGHVIYKKISWSTKDFPYLRWRWRANAFPKDAKILEDSKSDAVAQVYVSWKLGGRTYALKYFWSLSDPVGTSFHRGRWNPVGRYFGQVIRMGGATGEWVTETRNLAEDFKKAYGKAPAEVATGIGVLTDGDATQSDAKADYDDFEALVQP